VFHSSRSGLFTGHFCVIFSCLMWVWLAVVAVAAKWSKMCRSDVKLYFWTDLTHSNNKLKYCVIITNLTYSISRVTRTRSAWLMATYSTIVLIVRSTPKIFPIGLRGFWRLINRLIVRRINRLNCFNQLKHASKNYEVFFSFLNSSSRIFAT